MDVLRRQGERASEGEQAVHRLQVICKQSNSGLRQWIRLGWQMSDNRESGAELSLRKGIRAPVQRRMSGTRRSGVPTGQVRTRLRAC